MFGAVKSPEITARYSPRKRTSLSEKMSRLPKSVDMVLLWGSYSFIVVSQFLLDARRLRYDPGVSTGMPLLGEIMWRKAIECITRPSFLPFISELPPVAVALMTVSSFALFSLNSMRVLAAKSVQSHRMAVGTLLTLVAGILMTSDVVDYLILVVPLSVAVGITTALGKEDNSKRKKENKKKDDIKYDSGYESEDEEYDLEERYWVGKKVDYNYF